MGLKDSHILAKGETLGEKLRLYQRRELCFNGNTMDAFGETVKAFD